MGVEILPVDLVNAPELGVRAAHSDILHLRVVRFSVLVSSLDEECVAQGPAWGGDGGMRKGGNIGLHHPTQPRHFGPRRHLVVPRERAGSCASFSAPALGELTWRVLDRGRKASRRI